MPKSTLVDIAASIIVETERAYLINDGVKQEWVPKSQVEWNEDEKTFTMPEWLAMEKGFI